MYFRSTSYGNGIIATEMAFPNYHKESGTSYSTLSEVLNSVQVPCRVKSKHDMMTSSNGNIFRVTGHLCGEFRIRRSPVNSPHKGQWRGALIFSLICAWINAWVNNREAGDLRRHRAHYDVIVMNIYTLSKILLCGHRNYFHSTDAITSTVDWRPSAIT